MKTLKQLTHEAALALNDLANKPPSMETAHDMRKAITRLASLLPAICAEIERIDREIK